MVYWLACYLWERHVLHGLAVEVSPARLDMKQRDTAGEARYCSQDEREERLGFGEPVGVITSYQSRILSPKIATQNSRTSVSRHACN